MVGWPAVRRRIWRPACQAGLDGDLRQLWVQATGAGGGDGCQVAGGEGGGVAGHAQVSAGDDPAVPDGQAEGLDPPWRVDTAGPHHGRGRDPLAAADGDAVAVDFHHLGAEPDVHAPRAQRLEGVAAEGGVESGQQPVTALEQGDPHRRGIELRVVGFELVVEQEVGDVTRQLDAGRAAGDNSDAGVAGGRLAGVGGGGFERTQQPVPQPGRVGDLFQRYRMRSSARDTGEGRHHAGCQHQVVEAGRVAVIEQYPLAGPVGAENLVQVMRAGDIR